MRARKSRWPQKVVSLPKKSDALSFPRSIAEPACQKLPAIEHPIATNATAAELRRLKKGPVRPMLTWNKRAPMAADGV
jgi:hypothetical protein